MGSQEQMYELWMHYSSKVGRKLHGNMHFRIPFLHLFTVIDNRTPIRVMYAALVLVHAGAAAG